MMRCEVAVVGGGPVGLLLGCRLAALGIDVRVLERAPEPRPGSRAIGIHPPGLGCLAAVGVLSELVAKGIAIQQGLAFAGRRALGRIALSGLPGPYPFVLAVPQAETERVLEARLETLAPGALVRGCEVRELDLARGVVLTTRGRVRAEWVVGCDGKHSLVRRSLAVGFTGGPYRDRFLMGDFADDTRLGADAAIFLAADGLVESFPLPGGRRRWVVGTGGRRAAPDAGELALLVRARTDCEVRADTASMLSGFTAERYLAGGLWRGRVLLAGDAAHVLSPIGGQGMNLGWLDACVLADSLAACLRGDVAPVILAAYERGRTRAARAAIRRAALFMGLGRARRLHRPRDLLVRALLAPPLAGPSARLFTMQL
jgi:2-polyprenyl-6-methoxyphenol hydroxylase-like FAD-dependent oxidoreductase